MNKIKISELPSGMIIWKYGEILGITGATLPEQYYEDYCVKIEGNYFDYLLIESKGDDKKYEK